MRSEAHDERKTRDLQGERAARPVWGEIDLDAVSHNVGLIKRWLRPDVELTASVKGNAYGHGATQIVPVLEAASITQVMTASFSDAQAIRASGSGIRIVMLAGCLPQALGQYVRAGLIPTIYSMASAKALSSEVRRPTEVYVKVDAGLGRVGVAVEDAGTFVSRVARLPNLVVGGVYTHLPFADERGEAWARRRLQRFLAAMEKIRRAGIDVPYTQAVSSPGVLAGIDSEELTAVCVGSLIYGVPSLSTAPSDRSGLRPALSAIRARFIDITRSNASRRAGSGGRRRYAAGAITGVVPIGIQDGYRAPRDGGALQALVKGKRANVVGVSLAHTVLELTGLPAVSVGDEAVLVGSQLGDSIQLSDLAAASGATVLEVLMRLDQRIPYDYVSLGASGAVSDHGIVSSAPTY